MSNTAEARSSFSRLPAIWTDDELEKVTGDYAKALQRQQTRPSKRYVNMVETVPTAQRYELHNLHELAIEIDRRRDANQALAEIGEFGQPLANLNDAELGELLAEIHPDRHPRRALVKREISRRVLIARTEFNDTMAKLDSTPAQRVAAFLDGWTSSENGSQFRDFPMLNADDLREVLERLAKYEAAVSAVLAVKPMRKMSSNDPRAEGHAEALVTVREKLHNELPHPRN